MKILKPKSIKAWAVLNTDFNSICVDTHLSTKTKEPINTPWCKAIFGTRKEALVWKKNHFTMIFPEIKVVPVTITLTPKK